ncbi:MAG: DUF2249 domain-containing protein [Gemmatimonadota bacterium]
MTRPDPGAFDPAVLHELDVRDILRRGEQPLDLILQTADALEDGHVLHLRSPFEPIPLFKVMSERGFEHHGTMFDSDDWSTWFWRRDAPPIDRPPPVAGPRSPIDADVVDLRTLAAPEPMLRILELIERTDVAFRVAVPVFPVPLIAILDGYGWDVAVDAELEDGAFVVRVAPAGS